MRINECGKSDNDDDAFPVPHILQQFADPNLVIGFGWKLEGKTIASIFPHAESPFCLDGCCCEHLIPNSICGRRGNKIGLGNERGSFQKRLKKETAAANKNSGV